MESLNNGVLPQSCRRAVLTLLPKKGDLCLVKNWRPVALLCTDFKILSKCIANKHLLNVCRIIHKDQTYCIPVYTIRDNLFLIRDVLDLANVNNLNFGLFSIDQEKAFDRVDHSFLFKTLEAFGFREGFLSLVRLLYTKASCLVKVAGGLSQPIEVERGIRQGCPLSGLLYSLASESLLCSFREKRSGLLLPDSAFRNKIKVSAYADDIMVIVRNQRDVLALEKCIQIYEQASSARVNWEKSEALLCDSWQDFPPPKLPGSLVWRWEGLKVLGVFLGTPQYMEKKTGKV